MRLILILWIRGIGCPCLYLYRNWISSHPSYTKIKYVGALRSSTGPWHLSMSYSWSPRSRVPHQRQPLPLIVSDGLTKEVCLGLHYPVKQIRELGRKSGWLFVAFYLKQASTTCLMPYYSTTGKYKPDSLSVSISLTRSGLSRIISPYHQNMISKLVRGMTGQMSWWGCSWPIGLMGPERLETAFLLVWSYGYGEWSDPWDGSRTLIRRLLPRSLSSALFLWRIESCLAYLIWKVDSIPLASTILVSRIQSRPIGIGTDYGARLTRRGRVASFLFWIE